ncbi:hypothetical protein ACTVZO_41495 [Streptomyces sp. IBSNAI002]|uniref:hypothetical protein n=1 Tax=Streptomyces sp. IBSNAI002 TaxID=3457500 RepID=UPI003FD67481
MSENVSPQAVEQLVQDVSNSYAEEIRKERDSAGPNSERLKTLKEELAVCGADLLALEYASADEVAEIAARYAARSQELGGQ